MSRPVVCLYVVGAPPDPIRDRHGSFEDWFARMLAAHRVTMQPFDGRGGALPALDRLDGVIITGSPASLTEPEPWMEAAVELIRDAHLLRKPLLGVCFGHQLIGAAFGGQVMRNPRGWEMSTHDIELTSGGRRDPLFDGLPARFGVNLSHEDIVDADTLSPYNGIRVLAGSARSEVQAVAAGASIRGVQFHPEFSGQVAAAYVHARWERLAEDASQRAAPEDMPERLLARARDCPESEQVLHNFLVHFVLPAARPDRGG
jgi:GMP synthase (glutamine-hydrolysing)